ncbi:BrnT family toxin [Bradyrhizobium sp.]|uniref:BrnT family toxin n=1 Tax=Bradyrhizobium sp. TaxID=376 RepID=UPI0040378B53
MRFTMAHYVDAGVDRQGPDARFVYGEERMQVIGMAHRDVLFVVVTVRDDDICRIISARKATRHEQDRYYAGDRETW